MPISQAEYNAMLLRTQRAKDAESSVNPSSGVSRESELHDFIFDECRSRLWIPLHGSMAHRTHRTEGEPDFVILADAGRTILIEGKSAVGKLSPAQMAMQVHAARLGHTVHVVRSMEEFLTIANLKTT